MEFEFFLSERRIHFSQAVSVWSLVYSSISPALRTSTLRFTDAAGKSANGPRTSTVASLRSDIHVRLHKLSGERAFQQVAVRVVGHELTSFYYPSKTISGLGHLWKATM